MEHKPSYSDSLRADILPSYTDSLMHHGILGMKWGVRRYQNKDGSYTDAGKKRYLSNPITSWIQEKREYSETKKAMKAIEKRDGRFDKNFENRGKLEKQIIKEIENNKTVKEFLTFNDNLTAYLEDLAKQNGIDINQVVIDGELAELYSQKRDAAFGERRKIAEKHKSQYASALLKDLNIKETKGGHKYAMEMLDKEGFVGIWGG